MSGSAPSDRGPTRTTPGHPARTGAVWQPVVAPEHRCDRCVRCERRGPERDRPHASGGVAGLRHTAGVLTIGRVLLRRPSHDRREQSVHRSARTERSHPRTVRKPVSRPRDPQVGMLGARPLPPRLDPRAGRPPRPATRQGRHRPSAPAAVLPRVTRSGPAHAGPSATPLSTTHRHPRLRPRPRPDHPRRAAARHRLHRRRLPQDRLDAPRRPGCSDRSRAPGWPRPASTSAIRLAVSPTGLLLIIAAAVGLAVVWSLVVIARYRVLAPDATSTGQHLMGSVLVVLLALGVAAPAFEAAHLACRAAQPDHRPVRRRRRVGHRARRRVPPTPGATRTASTSCCSAATAATTGPASAPTPSSSPASTPRPARRRPSACRATSRSSPSPRTARCTTCTRTASTPAPRPRAC